jgi:HEXXH motif-containing protein
MVVATSGEQLDRFLAPGGDPDTLRRLAWRRSAIRLSILLASHRERPSNELSYLLGQLEIVDPEARHQVLATPEAALYADALLNNRAPDADIAAPVLSRLAVLSPTSGRQNFSWLGRLPLDYLPLGMRAVRMQGREIEDPELMVDGRRVRLSSTSGGLAMEVPIEITEGASECWSFRADRLEIIDGWVPFCDDFDDGNVSVNLDPSSRGTLGGILEEAIKLIRAAMPAALEEMRETAQYLSPIRPKDAGISELPSFSSPALPGVIFVGVQQGDGTWADARHLAESCVHEHLHNRLYLLDEAMPLTIRTAEPRSYFSPWKRTMRGIDGMLHAIYVFSHLVWFWRRVGDRLPDLQQYADRCVEEQVEHLDAAAGTIDTDELTDAGRRVLQSSTKNFHDLTAEV